MLSLWPSAAAPCFTLMADDDFSAFSAIAEPCFCGCLQVKTGDSIMLISF